MGLNHNLTMNACGWEGNELSKRPGRSKQGDPSKAASKVRSVRESQGVELEILKGTMKKRLQDHNVVARKARIRMDTSRDLWYSLE